MKPPFSLQISLVFCVWLLAFAASALAWPGPVYISDERIDALKSRIANKVEPNYTAWLGVLAAADAAMNSQPVVPETLATFSPYKDPEKHKAAAASTTFGKDGPSAYRLALAYRMTGDEKYAVAAARLLNAWSTGLKSIDAKNQNTSLTACGGIPTYIIAADLLKKSPSFPAADQERFKEFVRNVVVGSQSIELCMKRKNNWANFGTLLAITAGTYLGDKALFDRGVGRWKALIESQMTSDGTLHEEVSRPGGGSQAKVPGAMGMWYSNFTLMPATFAAEAARVNGVDLYNYTTPSQKNLRLSYEKMIPWIKNPASFPYYKGPDDPAKLTGVRLIPYFEMLVPRWPEADAKALLTASRPVRNNHAIPDATFTHGDLVKE